MNKKQTVLERIGSFISGKGFYLVVLVCIAAIGISGYYLVRTLGGLSDTLSAPAAANTQLVEAAATPQITLPSGPDPEDAEESADVVVESELPAATPATTPTPAPAPTRKPSAAARVFTWPVNGRIIAGFSVETLAYNETMLDWRTHDGIDIAAEVGARVRAAAAGTVTDLYEDDFMGVTMVIDHGDGLKSVYANLGAKPVVKVGDEVYTGDPIGTVGETAAAESGREPHLHLAMYQDGEPIDPETRLPK